MAPPVAKVEAPEVRGILRLKPPNLRPGVRRLREPISMASSPFSQNQSSLRFLHASVAMR
jgi:hypothetical protein